MWKALCSILVVVFLLSALNKPKPQTSKHRSKPIIVPLRIFYPDLQKSTYFHLHTDWFLSFMVLTIISTYLFLLVYCPSYALKCNLISLKGSKSCLIWSQICIPTSDAYLLVNRYCLNELKEWINGHSQLHYKTWP